jgi:starch synthase
VASRLRVLFVASEVAPFAKTGGLADVAGALPRALAALGHDVRILLPKYRGAEVHATDTRLVVPGIRVPLGDRETEGALIEGRAPSGGPVYLLEHEHYYNRDSLYGTADGDYWDNCERFVFLCRAALEGMARLDTARPGIRWQPQVIHANDWQTGLLPVYLRTLYRDHPLLGGLATVFTIHNLAYQGVFPSSCRRPLGIPERAAEFGTRRQLSFLQGGVAKASHITTVSETYARQITGPEHGCGLDGLLRKCMAEGRLTGIVNGIDHRHWDPARDPALWSPFTAGEWTRRRANGRELRAELGLLQGNGPLFAMVSRMVQQKGLDMICETVPQIVGAGGQLALIGRGDPALERRVAALAHCFPGRVAYHHGFDGELARRFFAGADFLLMPSRYEPCGLSQMYAQAYGCLPLAHATGGLRDTIEDGVTGLLFPEPTAVSLRQGLQRAFRVFAEPMLLDAMRGAAMLEKHGWEEPARRYAELYRHVLPQQAAA